MRRETVWIVPAALADFDKTTGELRHKHETVWDGREEQSETGDKKISKKN